MEKLEKRSAAEDQAPARTEDRAPARIERKKHKLLKSKAVRTRKIVRVKSGVDRPFLIIVILLLCIGTMMVFSSSYAYALYKHKDSYFFARKQVLLAAASLAVMWIAASVDYLLVKRLAFIVHGAAFALLILVFVIGKNVNGATRWIELGGLIQVQPSEIAKISVILFFADFCTRNQKNMKKFMYGVFPFALAGAVIGVLLLLEPHLSAMIIIMILLLSLMYLGGTRKLYLALVSLIGSAGMVAVMLLSSHGKERIMAWLNPAENIENKGWQPLQSLYAIGSGGLWGKGLGQSTQKHLWLPEPQNDYIFSILCEEMGFIFAVAVILLFIALVWRGFYIAKHAPTQYTTLVVQGIIIQLAVQILLNIAVVTNSIPSTGVSLPFFSYGGTALLITMAEMGFVLNISRYSIAEK